MYKIIKALSIIVMTVMITACNDEYEPEPASLVVNRTELAFSGYQSKLAVKVDATRRWSAVTSDWWISVSPDGYPSDGTHFVVNAAISVQDNNTGAPREGVVTFFIGDDAMAAVKVVQDIQNEADRPTEEFPITWANLQWAVSTVVAEGSPFEAGCCVYADGITNVMESTTGEDITCEIGYSTANTLPDGDDWTWTGCWFNGDWGDNFYYQGRIENLPAGAYFYTFRVRNGDGPYKYAGTDGLWDGIDNVSGTFEIKAASTGDIDYSQYTISWANIQWWASESINAGEQFEAGSKVLVPGLTDETESATGEGIVCEIGYASVDSDPSGAGWTWNPCAFNGDWGNEFYYQGRTTVIDVAGTYYYAFRYRLGDSGAWVYAGTDGIWDGVINTNRSFTVN